MNVKRVRLSAPAQRVLVILLGIAVLELGMTSKLAQLINLALHDSAASGTSEAKPGNTTRPATPPTGEPGGAPMPGPIGEPTAGVIPL